MQPPLQIKNERDLSRMHILYILHMHSIMPYNCNILPSTHAQTLDYSTPNIEYFQDIPRTHSLLLLLFFPLPSRTLNFNEPQQLKHLFIQMNI